MSNYIEIKQRILIDSDDLINNIIRNWKAEEIDSFIKKLSMLADMKNIEVENKN